MSFKNNEKRKGNRFTPCLTQSQSKYSDIQLLYEIQDCILSYILIITLYILPLILFNISLQKRPSPHTLSKAFSKSIKAQNNFLFLRISLLLTKIKILLHHQCRQVIKKYKKVINKFKYLTLSFDMFQIFLHIVYVNR